MNTATRLSASLCAIALFALTGCSDNGTPSEDAARAATSADLIATATETGTTDPCTASSIPGQMCRTVATATIENADYANRIAVNITTSPTIELLVGTQSGAVARHAVYPTSTSGSGGTGPTGNFPTKQDTFLTTVADITGDGTPEIVVQTGQFADHNEYQVLRLTDAGTLTVVSSPTYNMWTSGRDVWTPFQTTGLDSSIYRCPKPGQPGVTTSPLQNVTIVDGTRGSRTDYLYDHTADAWAQTAQEMFMSQGGVTTPVGDFDCDDQSQRQERTLSDKNDPFTPSTETSTAANPVCTFDPMADGRSTIINVVTGDISCADAQRTAHEYKTSDLPAGGNAAHRDNGTWHCSTPTAGENERTGRIMGCSASGETPPSWQFDVVVSS